MTEQPVPISVPAELAPLVRHQPEVLEVLRRQRLDLERLSGLSERDIELVRLGAALGLGAPPATYLAHVERARAVGVRPEEVWGIVMAVAPLVGVPRLLAAIPSIDQALGGHS